MQKGIFLQDLDTKLRTVNNAVIQLGDIDDSGKGRKFVSKFIQPGLVKIEGHGIVLLKKETLDASLPTIVGSPVIIQHKDVTEENADELRCGVIANAYFNQPDGWYYVDGIIWDDKAQDLINKGWSVSCSYDYLAFNDEGGEENNIHYDKEFTQLNFTHLAIVDNPRYERANIVFNCKTEDVVDNSKEIEMNIIDKLQELINSVKNNKENETMVENEKVDKRKLIDEVAGIMKSAGCDDEDIRTAIGKMEKIGYDDSEASADNKKVKNEADEEDKVDNESDEDKEKAEDLKEDEKKDVENKCKNSVENAKDEEFFDKINKIYNSAKKIEEPSVEYESKQARLDAGKEYFG